MSKKEKREAEADFKKTEFKKYLNIRECYFLVVCLILALILFTDFMSEVSTFVSILILIFIIAGNEYLYYKENKIS